MNYIKRLETDLADATDTLLLMQDRLQEFREHLSSPKFTDQVDHNGDRVDWIATGDVHRWIRYINTGL